MNLDKLLHFLAGYGIMATGIAIDEPGLGAVAVLIAAFLREVYNKAKGGKFDIEDIFATLLGGVCGGVAIMTLLWIV